MTRHRARFSDLSSGEQNLRGYFITFAGSVLTATAMVVGPMLSGSNQPSLKPESPQVVQTAAVLNGLSAGMFDGLALKDGPDANLSTIALLRIHLAQQQDPVVRNQIFGRVASFIRRRAVAPTGKTYGYCTRTVRPTLPVEVQAALNLLLQRTGADLSVRVDLRNVDLGYADFTNQRLDNINFDGSLLCRVIANGATFYGSTFEDANLRYAVATGAVGLDSGRLGTTYSLCGTVLPVPLRPDPTLRRLESTDPEPHLRCNVT
ncbi:MAG TPA: pentapeptide repeat-containing protein [Jatrophihabitans sp.]|nr:pentapeptide repeat-containing protein [Jatrophihabitans sp.]